MAYKIDRRILERHTTQHRRAVDLEAATLVDQSVRGPLAYHTAIVEVVGEVACAESGGMPLTSATVILLMASQNRWYASRPPAWLVWYEAVIRAQAVSVLCGINA